MTNYIEFSAKIKEKYPEYKDVDDLVLAQKIVEKYPEYKEKVTFDEAKTDKKGIDLTPSGLVDKAVNTINAAIDTPVRMIKDNQSIGDAFKSGYENSANNREQIKAMNPVQSKIQDITTDLMTYGKIPILRGNGIKSFIGNTALQGGLPGALEGLKSDNLGEGAATGATIAGLLQSIPYIGKGVGWLGNKIYLNSFPGLKEKTVKQLIKPDSIGLDLTEDTAQNLLMDTTEKIQKGYKSLMDKAGQDVQKAALNLPEERGVFTSSLKDALNDIFKGNQVSKNEALNSAMNNHSDIYDNITNLINSSEIPEKMSAPELFDLMKNIKDYKINWNSSDVADKQKLLKDIYWEFSRRLGNLSPELRAANKTYSRLAKFDDNEGVKRIINPQKIKDGTIDTASETLRNYNKTISSGNRSRNITNLEKLFVANGKQPFLNTIDDINAANELLKTAENGFNPFGLTDKIKLLEKPILLANRKINQIAKNNQLPEKIQTIQEMLMPFAERLPMATTKGVTSLLFGNNQ